MPKKRNPTRFFQTCLGVFQGGGCRGAAFVGALEEAEARKVAFAGVAGTSAGSILAALVGAGADSVFLKQSVAQLNFMSLLSKPEDVQKESLGLLTRSSLGLASLFSSHAAQALKVIKFHGLYSSQELERWINDKLRELLPKAKPPIHFFDLPIPTYIVAADIRTNDVKVWSSEKTPNDEVAFAVRCSCSIPGFFQPVQLRYIDGGILSNLPAFVFSEAIFGNTRPFANRILAFTLKSSQEDTTPKTGMEMFRATINTVVDGATAVQGRLMQSVHEIRIDTGQIKATDFEKMDQTQVNSLISRGAECTAEFFDNELSRVSSAEQGPKRLYGTDEIYASLTESLDEIKINKIVICDTTAKWAYSIFPTLLAWRIRGAEIHVILDLREALSDHELYQRRLLRALGVELYFSKTIPFSGFLLNPDDEERAKAIIVCPDLVGDDLVAVRYEGRFDFPAISALWKTACQFITNDPKKLNASPELRRVDESKILDKLRQFVPAYSTAGTKLSMERVRVESLELLTKFVRGYKFKQIQQMFELYAGRNLDPFDAAEVHYKEDFSTLVTPPVAEDTGKAYVLVQGNTRALYCLKNDIAEFRCVVVRNQQTPLPSTQRVALKEVLIGGRTISTIERYNGPIDKDYRNIEWATHHPKYTLTGVQL